MTYSSVQQRDLIKSLSTENLSEFITNKTEQRNDLWRAAVELREEADRFQRQGNDLNYELAIARVEQGKRTKNADS